MLVPFIVDLVGRELLWVDVHVTSHGYGHRAGRHSSNLGRLGADLWQHFASGQRATLFDLAAWHAAGRAHEIYAADFSTQRATRVATHASITAEALRRAASLPYDGAMPNVAGRSVLAVVADAESIGVVLGNSCAEGSLVAAPIGRATPPWQTLRPEELLAGLNPTK